MKIRDETAVFFQKPAFFFKLIFIAIPLSYVSYALSIHEGVVFLLKTHEFVNILNPKPYPALHKKNDLHQTDNPVLASFSSVT
ncbi:hypothetical protein CHR37_15440 [Bacillus velezensis]|nr:hypothetical protein CFN60_15545 [Bacillus velezensis]ATV24069.1 hypothetical protein CS547_15600 [Bacillus sp. Lzh-5]AWM45422.1 hypothetical protein BAALB65_15905 [Bacillus amyloliquefaciens]ATY29606.1 hypothetical protein CVD07_15510 [Bacillus velezensis]AUG37345.1 hypothetical protein CXP43_17110 [Bacillus velezensis]